MDAASPRTRRRVRDTDAAAAQAPSDDATPAGDAVGSPDADGLTGPTPTPAPDDVAPVRGDGLPPGALGAGAAGAGLGLFGAGVVGEVPSPDTDARPGRRKGRRRGKRGAGEPDADGRTGEAEKPPERPLTAEERLQHALTLAYRHLSKRDRTVSEVRAHLEKREIDETSIVGALKELTDFGYVDDERYATRFVEDKRRLEGWGHLRIEQGLRKTGIPREVADRALAEDPLRDDEDELAVEALEQRLAGRPLEDDRARQKALRLLATKGYALETAYAAVRAYERRCAEREDG
jgi:regulatory protein